MTTDELQALVGKTGRIVPTTGKPEWGGKYVCTSVDAPRLLALDEIGGHKYAPATVNVESVARRIEYPASGAPPRETSDPFERAEALPAEWFVPDP
jgi:hypothetical protein